MISEISKAPIYEESEFARDVIDTVQKSKGYANPSLNELLVNIRQYWTMSLNLANMDFIRAKGYYNELDIVELHEMMTYKMAIEFRELDPEIINEYYKIIGK